MTITLQEVGASSRRRRVAALLAAPVLTGASLAAIQFLVASAMSQIS